MNTFIFGAGSSYGTLGCIAPIASRFWGELANLRGWPGDFPKLSAVVAHLGEKGVNPGLEPIWTCIDYYDKLRGALPDKDWSNPYSRASAVPELKRALLMIYGKRCDEAAKNLPLTEHHTLGELLSNVQPGDVLISFNYDTVLEALAHRLGHTLRVYCDELRNDVVNFVKPHGSTTWIMNLESGPVIWKKPDGGVILDSLHENEVTRQKQPLLLGAVPIKSELIEEVQSAYNVHGVFDVVMKQWRAVREAMEKADLLVVVGYSFPREDHYGRFLFSEVRRSAPLKVEFFEVRTRVSERVDSILSAFPHFEIQLEWKGPVRSCASRQPVT